MPRREALTRRRPLLPALAIASVIVAAAAGASMTPSAVPAEAAAQAPPNVLVIETDDQTARSLRFMPKVNSLIVDKGTLFRRSFVNYSLCCPSRATFLTGQYAHNHGVMTNDAGFDRFEALHARNNLAVWLRRSGYHTALIGKYLNGYPGDIVPPGWSEWFATNRRSSRYYDYSMNDNGTRVPYGLKATDYKEDVLTRKAVRLVRRRAPKPRPFFLWLTYTAPHFGGPTKSPHRPVNCAGTAKPAPRDAHAFDSERLPKPPNFNEENVSDKPAEIRKLPLLDSSRIATIRRKYRCRLESLLSVDDGVKRVTGR